MVGVVVPAVGMPEPLEGMETRAEPEAVGLGEGLGVGVGVAVWPEGEEVRAGSSDSPAAMTTKERLRVWRIPLASV